MEKTQKARPWVQKLTILRLPINFWTAAALSLALIGLSYALYLPSLGYYLDDWPQLYSLVVRGTEGIKTYFLYDDRPFGWWPDLLFFKLWGTNAIGWHITNYLLRWLVGLGIWGLFTRIWKEHKREVFWAVQLFAVFPLFNQQSMGLTFIAHWSCYVLFFLSLYLMVLAVQHPRHTIWLMGLSLLVNAGNLFTYENFIGVEFLRPVFLWLILHGQPKKTRLKKVILFWLPFLVLAGFYVFWRVFLMENIRGLDPVLFHNLISQPFSTLLQLGTRALNDILFMFLGVWYPALDTNVIDLRVPYKVIPLGLIVTSIVGLLLLLSRRDDLEREQFEIKDSFALEALLVGILGVVMGLAPGWLVNRSLTEPGLWNDRFGFPGMWAAPFFIIGLLQMLFRRQTHIREIIIIVLLGLAVGRNFAVTNEYKWSTTWQNRFAAQLKWRAPDIRDDTAILADNELFTKMGVYPTSFMVNLIYPEQQVEKIRVDYWFLTLGKYFSDDLNDLVSGMGIYQQHWYAKFAGWSTESLVINWDRAGTGCLWVLTTNDRYNPLITGNTRQALGATNLNNIKANSDMLWPDEKLFGKEDRNTWCYYYETADLARQMGDYAKVISLYQDATAAGYSPSNGVELIPFIEAYARVGQADVAADLTVQAKALTPGMRNYTCDTWNRLATDISNDPLFVSEYEALSEQDLCWEVK
jgi:hypothetical protein